MKTKYDFLSNFLDYKLWQEAKKLLDYQVNAKENNAHFRNLSMYAYERLEGKEKNKVGSKEFFTRKIENGAFYISPQDFFSVSFGLPKSGLGIRRYEFLSYPLRILHYAIGLYIWNLTRNFRENLLNKNDRINTFYGGSLRKNDGEFIRDNETIYYKSHYKTFQKHVENELESKGSNKFLLKLDIQNCFEEISVSGLLMKLRNKLKESTKKGENFSPATRTEIKYFYQFLFGEKAGILQTDNDIISKFLAQIYLSFVDLSFEDKINSSNVDNYEIIRYVDDYYIFVEFLENKPEREANSNLTELSVSFSDELYNNYGLRLNNKCSVFDLNHEEEKDEVRKRLKNVSPRSHASLDIEANNPKKILRQIIEALQAINEKNIDPDLQHNSDLETERYIDNLKGIYDKHVRGYLESNENWKEKLSSSLKEFDYELVKLEPGALSVLIKQFDEISNDYEKFLNNKQNLTYKDISAILEYLSQDGFENDDLITKLSAKNKFDFVDGIFKQRGTSETTSSVDLYRNLSSSKMAFILNDEKIIFQARLRTLRENKNDFSVALNHLLNELHLIIWNADQGSEKEEIKWYNAKDVRKFLKQQTGVSNDTIIKIRKLFDRRNINTISHSTPVAFAVKEEEYWEYKEEVKECIENAVPDSS